MINALSNVELMSPPSITLAMGDCISLPGRSPPSASGTSANAEVRAVMSMGLSRESEPSMMASFTVLPSSVRSRLYSVMSSMPLRVAMPKSEMKPMIAEDDGKDAADERQWQIEQYHTGLHRAAELHEQQQEDDGDGYRAGEIEHP